MKKITSLLILNCVCLMTYSQCSVTIAINSHPSTDVNTSEFFLQEVAQVFTTNISTSNFDVMLQLYTCKPNGLTDAILDIVTVTAGEPDWSNVIGTAIVPENQIYGTPGCVPDNIFSSNIFSYTGVPLTAGNQYALVLRVTAGGIYWRNGEPWNWYPGGSAWEYDLMFSQSNISTNRDFQFDIYTGTNNSAGTDTQVACNSYTWIDANTYTANNNTATFNIVGGSSCGGDSLVTLDLTINSATAGSDVQFACDTYTWIDANTYTSNNNTATVTLTNANGCDSIVTLDLTINNNSSTDIQVACDSYTWIDANIYTSNNNTATVTLTNVAGCDSVVTLDLTINNSNTGTDTQVACDTYTWIDANTYTSNNNSATVTLTNANGCDSLVTLDLTINNSSSGTDSQVACDSYTWIDANTYTASNNTATVTLTNVAGCDSVVTLDLTITNSSASTDTQVGCNSYTWIDGNTYTANNNIATFNIVGGNANGCDSLVTLDLTIFPLNVNTITIGYVISSLVSGASYQWLDCDNNYTIIPGETSQALNATANGNFAVEITQNGCSDTSACTPIIGIGINENSLFNNVSIYPNPNQGLVNISLGNLKDVSIKLFSITGQVIYEQQNINTSTHQFELNNAPGLYFIQISSKGEQQQYKLIKK